MVEKVQYLHTPFQSKVRAHSFPGAENRFYPQILEPRFDRKAQKYKLLFHQYAGCTDGATVGGYAESATADFFGNWIYDYSFTGYSMNAVPFVDGSNISFHRRERPKVYLENGVAKYLYNGVSPPGAGNNVFTFVQEIDEPPAEPPRRGLKLDDGETNLGARARANTKGYSSTYLAMVLADVRAGTQTYYDF